MNLILENVDGIHLETISIESSYRKTQESTAFKILEPLEFLPNL